MIWRMMIPGLVGVALMAATAYHDEVAEWRRQRVANLQKDGGWLTVAGLFWLHDGANTFGKATGNEIVLPDGPAKAGTFEWHGGKVAVRMDGALKELRPDSDDAVKVGRLSLYVIKRGDKMGIRLKDPEAEYRRNFKGIENYPVKDEYRVVAKWVSAPEKMPVLNMIGQTEPVDSPGYAEFTLHGQKLHLRPYIEEPGDKELFYVFRDLTTGKETYPAGRFFYSGMPENGKVVLDFNKAYNPPCAFTPYATCPLPPAENKLAVRIEAGEKKYGDH